MKEHYDELKEANEKQQNMLKNKGKNNNISRPNIAPTPNYTAKAPRK
jgi:hypothetical protein